MNENKQILTITDSALNRAKFLINKTDSDVIGLRVGIKTAGCSGLKYNIEYAKEIKPHEEKVLIDDILILIDPAATMFLIGSRMDYKESKFSSGFEFENPNEISRCGCGESFTVSNS
tara:strand:+ start:1025 stop:1375 length:351 start_codon:yes stop_codon:yes gene_type:complete